MARYAAEGHRAVFLHLTLGEKGHSRLSASQYGEEKRLGAEAIARDLGCEVRFMPYGDAELEDSEQAKLAVCDVIREIRPSILITNWQGSIHRDHRRAHDITCDARFLAGLKWIQRDRPEVHVPHLLFAENWEDMDGFRPDFYVDTTSTYDQWLSALEHYAIFRDPSVGGFRYRDYYTALSQMRGCLSGFDRAEAFMRPDSDLIDHRGELLK